MKRILIYILVLIGTASIAWAACTIPAGDKRIQYCEKMVGANDPYGQTDTLNRLTRVEHNIDGTHVSGNLTETGSSVLTITGGTKAVLHGNATIQVKQASASQNGYLSATDWSTFNSANNYRLTICTPPLTCNFTTHTLAIPQASAGASGYLSSSDWTIFNNKQAALGFTAVPTTRTVNGHALSSDVTISASDLTTGVLGATYGGTGVNDLSFSGTTHKVVTLNGSSSDGHYAIFDADGNVMDGGTGTGGASGLVSLGRGGVQTNISLGYQISHAGIDPPLSSNTVGYNNVAIGPQALRDNTTGFSNVAIGNASLALLTTGQSNTAIGGDAGSSITTANYNTALGLGAFLSTAGNWNTAIGTNCMGTAGTATENTVVGGGAAYNNTNGSYNTALGFKSLYTNATGNSNVALGYKAGYYETGSNKLFIDNATRSNEADGRVKALVYGIFDAAPANQYLTVNGHVTVNEGHFKTTQATNPVVSSCGTVAGTAVGTDNSMLVTFGTGTVTECTVTFNKTFGTAPNCTCSHQSATPVACGFSAISATAFTINTNADEHEESFSVLCF